MGKDYRLVLNVGKGIQAYYKSLIPKVLAFQDSMHRPHVTVVRPKRDVPANLKNWKKYQGYKVWYTYDPFIRYSSTYVWINVWSRDLHDIRKELGLKPWQTWRVPPDGKDLSHYGECFHITLGNNKQEEKPFPYTLLPIRDYERMP